MSTDQKTRAWMEVDPASLRQNLARVRASVGPGPALIPMVKADGYGLGMADADTPIQRHFYLGGPETFRGTLTGDLTGSAFWFGRAEVATDFPAARLVAFSDFAWVGTEEKFDTDGFASSVGVGASLLDGLLRIDLAHVLKGEEGTRLHIYFDGLF